MKDRADFDSTGGRFLAPRDASPVSDAINSFIYSNWYIAFIGVLTLISNIFSAELFVYPLYFSIAIYIALFCRDTLPMMPLFAFGYVSPSLGNNPGKNPESIFYPDQGGIFLLLMAAALLLSMVVRIAMDRPFRQRFFCTKRSLGFGMLLLGAAYLLSGIGSENYESVMWKNLLFAALQFVSVAGLYWYFSGSVQWERVRKSYFASIGLGVAIVLLAELLNIYLSGNVIIDGAIDRAGILTGWGIHNNIGGLLAMMLPFAYYFASQSKRSAWLFHLLGLVILCGVVFSNSRSSIIGAGCIYLISLMIILSNAKNKWQVVFSYAVDAVLLLTCVLLFKDRIASVFRVLLEVGFNPNGRDTIYKDAVMQYIKYPVLGESFYIEASQWHFFKIEKFNSIFPFRWHNTIAQIAASCGTVGLIAYGIHRVQTVALFFKKENRTTSKIFIGLSVLVLLGTSLLDCHFFNIGPALFYSMALAFAEHSSGDDAQ